MSIHYDPSIIPSNILTLRGDEFFKCIKQLSGEVICDLLKIQLIDSTEVLINTDDLFEIFQYNSPEINCLRDKIYFKADDDGYILKSGIRTNLLNEEKNNNKIAVLTNNKKKYTATLLTIILY